MRCGLLMVLGYALSYSSFSAALNGDINLYGDLVEEPCSLSMSSSPQTVKFGNVIKNTLYLHQRTVSYPFSITLEECDISLGNLVEVSFNGAEDKLLHGLIATTGTAKGIAIGLETASGKPIEINKTIKTYELHDGLQKLKFSAYIKSPDSVIENESIIEGDFSANVSFTLNYP